MSKTIEGVNGTTGKVLDWVSFVSRVLLIPTLGIISYAFWNHEVRINDHETRIAVREANAFTAQDGLEVWQSIAVIKGQLDSKADAIGAVPVREDIAEIKRELERLREQR